MYFVTVVHFYILCSSAYGARKLYDDELPFGQKRSEDMILKGAPGDGDNDELDVRQYQAELAQGDHSMFMGSNPHHHEPHWYKDLSRRFVPVYPYTYKGKPKHKKLSDLEELFQYIETSKKSDDDERDGPIPIRAPPDVVVAIMKLAKRSQKAERSDSDVDDLQQYMLRSGGNYWDGVWEEEVNPDNILRENKYKHHKKASDDNEELFQGSQPIKAKLIPGTKLYKLISKIVKKVPKLVYFMEE